MVDNKAPTDLKVNAGRALLEKFMFGKSRKNRLEKIDGGYRLEITAQNLNTTCNDIVDYEDRVDKIKAFVASLGINADQEIKYEEKKKPFIAYWAVDYEDIRDYLAHYITFSSEIELEIRNKLAAINGQKHNRQH